MARFIVEIAKCTVISAVHVHKGNLLTVPRTKISAPFSRSITTTLHLRAGRWYTSEHEWVTIDGEIGTIGISDYAQAALGDIVYAQLPDVGSVIGKAEECGALESVKAASEIISPLSGEVIEKNEAVESKPNLVNTSCYKEGWLFKLKISNPEELSYLMNEDAYTMFLKTNTT